ncbi:MAG: hypothetical protein PWR10_1546 [Halanaerobiales bacterium]|nr:hypothetical protein [Halanaerobiales bacterium]
MIVNQSALTSMYKSFKVLFNETFKNAETYREKVATEVPSTTRENAYKWLGSFPRLREWIGERQVKQLAAHDYAIKNKSFEATIEVDRDDIEDDQYGIYRPMIEEMGRAAKAHPDILVFEVLNKGFENFCYDGQYFFDTDHPVKGQSVSNFQGGSGTPWFLLDTTRAIKPIIFQMRRKPQFVSLDKVDDENVFMKKKFLYGVDYRGNAGYGLWQLAYASKQDLTAENYASARAAMMSFKDDEGVALGIKPNLLVVPPSLEGAAKEILENERDANGATNKWRNTADLLVVPYLA